MKYVFTAKPPMEDVWGLKSNAQRRRQFQQFESNICRLPGKDQSCLHMLVYRLLRKIDGDVPIDIVVEGLAARFDIHRNIAPAL